MTTNPLKLRDTTFRDAHQSLMATRLRTEDMVPLAEAMEQTLISAVIIVAVKFL